MKKSFLLIIFLMLIMPNFVSAASYYGVINDSNVRIRKQIDSKDSYTMANNGATFDMPNNDELDETTDTGCSTKKWKQVYYEGSIGYVCSAYINVYEKTAPTVDNTEAKTECENQLKQAGFPSSYWSGLCNLKIMHPTWNFVAVDKDVNGNTIDWNASVNAESACGKTSIASSSKAEFIDATCNKTWDSGYSAASRAALVYYMDPRNFFNEKNIFMFEGQNVNSAISDEIYRNAVTKLFNNNFLIQQIPEIVDYISAAAIQTGLSGTAIASRIKQELGSAKLTSGEYAGQLYSVVSGNYTTRYPSKVASDGHSLDNYYNFFNVAAYDGSGVTEQALNYAYKHNWGGTGNQYEDRKTALILGAEFLKNKYADVGQYTQYFQKFNIFPTTVTSRYLHQYMTNIKAPSSESAIVYNAYKDAGVLESAFTFYIPVYQGMDEKWTETVDNTTTNNNSNPPETIIQGAGYKYQGSIINGIPIGTNATDLKNSLESIGGPGSVIITDTAGNQIDSQLATGYKVQIQGSTTETFDVVVYGDVSGDGVINALDLLKIQKHILGTGKLEGAYLAASDPSKDGEVNALDLLKVQKSILGTGSIEQ